MQNVKAWSDNLALWAGAQNPVHPAAIPRFRGPTAYQSFTLHAPPMLTHSMRGGLGHRGGGFANLPDFFWVTDDDGNILHRT